MENQGLTPSIYDKIMKVILGVSGAIIFILVVSSLVGSSDDGLDLGNGPKIGVVSINGGIFGSERIVSQLDKFSRRDDIEAIIVRINSPGGSVAATQEIYEKIRKIREEGKKPIIASMGTVAASGGVYVAMGAELIMANSGTTTGSIGVIMDYPIAVGLMEKLGIGVEVIKSGPFKDSGSPFRAPTQADRNYFQGIIDDMYEQFMEVIANERNLDPGEVRTMATGEVFTGRRAHELGLIDTLGTFEDAIGLAGDLIGNTDRPVIVKPYERKRLTLWDLVFGQQVYESDWYPQLLPQYLMR